MSAGRRGRRASTNRLCSHALMKVRQTPQGRSGGPISTVTIAARIKEPPYKAVPTLRPRKLTQPREATPRSAEQSPESTQKRADAAKLTTVYRRGCVVLCGRDPILWRGSTVVHPGPSPRPRAVPWRPSLVCFPRRHVSTSGSTPVAKAGRDWFGWQPSAYSSAGIRAYVHSMCCGR